MRIAIIGGGVSGLVCADALHDEHEITLFESGPRVGGHSNTLSVEHENASIDVDTGFIVFNRRNYPNFCSLIERLGVPHKPAPMSFSVKCERSGIEYGGQTLNGIFAQRRNLLRPSFHRMLRDILRFYREAEPSLADPSTPETLGEYLDSNGYSSQFVERFIVPMGAAIWSTSIDDMRDFPLRFFVEFFHNHGMLDLNDRPEWLTIDGGSRVYVERLVEPFRDRVRTDAPVRAIARDAAGVTVRTDDGPERFDEVVFACHADQTLAILGASATDREREILGALPYEPSDTVLHTDASVLPRSRRAWSAWNYHLLRNDPGKAVVTYNLSILQSLPTRTPLLVTLNHTDAIDPSKVLARMTYAHPQYTLRSIDAQGRYAEIGGHNRTHFCGAYWFNGFHEDGVRSALRVAESLRDARLAVPA